MEEKRILYLDPVGEKPELHRAMAEYLNRHRKSGYAPVAVRSLGQGPLNLEYYTYLSLVGPDILRTLKQAEEEGYDAAIIGCFCDPALEAAKELCRHMVVVGVMEASVHLASHLAPKFSILAARQKSVADFEDNLRRYGLLSRLASFRSLEVCVEDLQGDERMVHQRMREEIQAAIQQDGAEAVVLGCTLQMGHFAQLQQEFGVPVIDVQLAGLLLAEQLIEARERCGWYTSKLCSYALPPKGQLARQGLAQKYGMGEL